MREVRGIKVCWHTEIGETYWEAWVAPWSFCRAFLRTDNNLLKASMSWIKSWKSCWTSNARCKIGVVKRKGDKSRHGWGRGESPFNRWINTSALFSRFPSIVWKWRELVGDLWLWLPAIHSVPTFSWRSLPQCLKLKLCRQDEIENLLGVYFHFFTFGHLLYRRSKSPDYS